MRFLEQQLLGYWAARCSYVLLCALGCPDEHGQGNPHLIVSPMKKPIVFSLPHYWASTPAQAKPRPSLPAAPHTLVQGLRSHIPHKGDRPVSSPSKERSHTMPSSATRDTRDPTCYEGCRVIVKLHYLRDLGQGVSHKQRSPSQPTGQQRHNKGKGRGHVVPTPIHQLVQQLHLLAGTLQLGGMLQAKGEGDNLVTHLCHQILSKRDMLEVG